MTTIPTTELLAAACRSHGHRYNKDMKPKSSSKQNIEKLQDELFELTMGLVDLTRDNIEIQDAIKKMHERMKQIDAELELAEAKSSGVPLN